MSCEILLRAKRPERTIHLTNRELASKASALEEANDELSQYAYVVSHDIRAPLRAIHNYADFLREDLEGTLEDEQTAYLNGLTHAVHEAETLVEDLLTLSRVGRQEISIETTHMSPFLHRLVELLELPTDVELVIADDWPTINTEPTLLRQIMQNLILNGIKFNQASPKRIELGWKSVDAAQYEFFVRDNGIGIAPQYQEQIFRVFERLHTRDEFEGTGIGLAIVQKAANKLGGSVRLESEVGKGTTFFIKLPAKLEENETV